LRPIAWPNLFEDTLLTSWSRRRTGQFIDHRQSRGSAEYIGGDFHLRRKTDKAPQVHFRYERPGRALIFDVSPDNEHQLEPLTSGGPRRIFADWFMV